MSRDDDIRAAIEAHPLGEKLARLARSAALAAADERRARFGDGLDELAKELDIPSDEAVIDGVAVLKVLARAEPPVEKGRRLLGVLVAHAIALEPPDDQAAGHLAEALAWLAAHTYIDPLSSLSEQAGARLWPALAALVRATDERGAPAGRGSALAAATALGASEDPRAQEEVRQLAPRLRDPLLLRALSAARPEGAPASATAGALRGELVPAPSSPVGLFLWCASGLILLRYLWRFVSGVLLRAQRPAEVTIEKTGVTLAASLELLGRRLRERRIHIPLDNLARAEREVRYPRLGLYAGLFALALGTFVGASLVADGAGSGSPSLLAIGAVVFAVGLVLDWLLGTLLPARRAKHRLVFVPRKGPSLAVRVDDEAAADRALRLLSSS